LLKIPNGPDDLGIVHVAHGVIIQPNRQDARMVALRNLNEQMKVLEVIVIFGHENQPVPDSIGEMAWVWRTGQKCVGRHHCLVTRLPEPSHEGALGRIVVEVKVHYSAGTAAGA
jgi:hypothetical protein